MKIRVTILKLVSFLSLSLGLLSHLSNIGKNFTIRSLSTAMSKHEKSEYVNPKTDLKKVSLEDLKNALSEVEKENIKVRESFRYDNEALSFRASR